MKIERRQITELMEGLGGSRLVALNSRVAAGSSQAEESVIIADTRGFHIYGDIHLKLKLSAATDQKAASKYLQILQEAADIISTISREIRNLFIFEVQGDRFHLYLEPDTASDRSIPKLLQVCWLITTAFYQRLRPFAGEDWDGFCMAADFGRAIVVTTGFDGDDSVISLGDPANRPAKRLSWAPRVQAGHLAIPMDIMDRPPLRRNGQVAGWHEIDLKDANVAVQGSSAFAAVLKSASARVAMNEAAPPVIFAKAAAELYDADGTTVSSPALVRGFVMRADLDGFTARVRNAFNLGTEDAVKRLVEEFCAVMRLPSAFEDAVRGRIVRLPWAGDCYNAIILPDADDTYENAQTHVPATVPLQWHDPDGAVNRKRPEPLQTVAQRNKWSVGISGGDASGGVLLVANLETPGRRFLVASGWGSRRSLDASNSDDLGSGYTAIHEEDQPALDEPLRRAFTVWPGGGSLFRRASAAALAGARTAAAEAKTFTNSRPVIAAPRPYAH